MEKRKLSADGPTMDKTILSPDGLAMDKTILSLDGPVMQKASGVRSTTLTTRASSPTVSMWNSLVSFSRLIFA
jgi:hypothetical protein